MHTSYLSTQCTWFIQMTSHTFQLSCQRKLHKNTHNCKLSRNSQGCTQIVWEHNAPDSFKWHCATSPAIMSKEPSQERTQLLTCKEPSPGCTQVIWVRNALIRSYDIALISNYHAKVVLTRMHTIFNSQGNLTRMHTSWSEYTMN